MAPKKEVSSLGAVQEHGDGWRAEVANVGKGPSRSPYSEAVADLTLARQVNSRDEMKQVLRELVAGTMVEEPVGQPLAANREIDRSGRDRSRSR